MWVARKEKGLSEGEGWPNQRRKPRGANGSRKPTRRRRNYEEDDKIKKPFKGVSVLKKKKITKQKKLRFTTLSLNAVSNPLAPHTSHFSGEVLKVTDHIRPRRRKVGREGEEERAQTATNGSEDHRLAAVVLQCRTPTKGITTGSSI